MWLRVALAVRDADGHEILPEEALEDLPCMGGAVSQILRRAGMLQPRRQASPPARWNSGKAGYGSPPPPSPRACRDCDTWMAYPRSRCQACKHWRNAGHPIGRCRRCRRDKVPLREEHCRACLSHISQHGPQVTDEPFTQLWFGAPIPARQPIRHNPLNPDNRPRGRDVWKIASSAHIVVLGQQVLFAVERDWSPLVGRRTEDLPRLTKSARTLVDDFAQVMGDQQWEKSRRAANLRTLTVLVSWLGADAPIAEADVHNLAKLDGYLPAKRVCQFLQSRSLLVPDPDRRRDRNRDWIEQVISRLPRQFAYELRSWVRVLRGEGRWEYPALDYDSIRRYLSTLQPVLEQWISEGVTSLRQITHDHVADAMGARQGNPARAIHGALRSLFRVLKQGRMIFRDPSRGLTHGGAEILPQVVPSDLLAGLLDHTDGALQRLIIALVAVHALPGHEIARLLTSDLDLAAGRQIVRRGRLRHTLYLEETTHRLVSEWLAERHRRWPACTNPHLLISSHTAVDPEHPTISVEVLRRTFRPLGVTMSQLRQDRILHEAHETADPLRLMRLFGISDGTAMRYVGTAHPEKTARSLR
jgi:integrase